MLDHIKTQNLELYEAIPKTTAVTYSSSDFSTVHDLQWLGFFEGLQVEFLYAPRTMLMPIDRTADDVKEGIEWAYLIPTTRESATIEFNLYPDTMLIPNFDINSRRYLGIFPFIKGNLSPENLDEINEDAQTAYSELFTEEYEPVSLQNWENDFLYKLFAQNRSIAPMVSKGQVTISFAGFLQKCKRSDFDSIVVFDIAPDNFSDKKGLQNYVKREFPFLPQPPHPSENNYKTPKICTNHKEILATFDLNTYIENSKKRFGLTLEAWENSLKSAEPQKTELLEHSEPKMETWEGNFWKNKLNTDLLSWGNMPEQVRLEALS